MRRPSARQGFTLIELLIVILILGVLHAIAVPNFGGCRRYSGPRACFANQKTIAGAIEMYNLDFNTNVQRITPELAAKLEKEGYLQQYPQDPGGKGEYRMHPFSGNGIYCTEHGPIQGSKPDVWKALEARDPSAALGPVTPTPEMEWFLREMQDSYAAERRRLHIQGALFGGAVALGIPLTVGFLLWTAGLAMRRVRGVPVASQAAPTETAEDSGVLQVLARRGVASAWTPWSASRPDPEACCPICSERFQGVVAEACPSCLAPHHPECRDFNGGCGIYACGQR